jgi:hypothetical protein
MDTCLLFSLLAVACFFACCSILLLHKVRHSSRALHPDDFIDDECEQWFQWRLCMHSDCNDLASCSHEKWVVALVAAGIVATTLSMTLPCSQ